ncbi:MAG TPA: hypothetical protein VEU74_04095, partial [Gemmatimonadales bacterium]|nr:hypothetical protein [Gemmatimonadales bacterium]
MVKVPSLRLASSAALASAVLCTSCTHQVVRTLVPADRAATLDGNSPYLKAHLRSGYVYVLSDWHAESAGVVLRGHGRLLDANRSPVTEGDFRFPADSVALFETNVVHGSGANTALTVMAGVTAAVAGICVASPKTCFGSCPTFYAPDSLGESLQAEAFSSSIAPALEATDVDMLYRAKPRGRDFVLRMRNEALETHVIRHADVLALPRPPGGRVFVTPEGRFRAASRLTAPSRCRAAEGDCLAAVVAFDGRERWSLADSTDLAAREIIELEFDDVPGSEVGLVVASRQTMMTTYLFYQALAYLGGDVGNWLSALETGGPTVRERAGALSRALGQIDILVAGVADTWTAAGSVGETGPIAVDTKIVPLATPAARPLRVRLRLTRGLWRIDYVALAALGDSLSPLRLPPRRVRRTGRDEPAALRALVDRVQPL